MFILTEKDIEYCRVTDSESPLEKDYLGISYRGFLFFQVGSYELNQWEKAIQSCRKFLERKEPVTSIILKKAENVSLWCENERLHLISSSRNSVARKTSNSENETDNTIDYRGQTLDSEEKKPIRASISEAGIITRKIVMKYRGQEVIKEVKQKVTPSQIHQNKILRYRGTNY